MGRGIIMKKEIKQKDVDRFWRSVTKHGDEECWDWNLCTTSQGYALFSAAGGLHRAQRFAYTYSIGPIPRGLRIATTCRSKTCCNPKHLYTATQRELLEVARERGTLSVGSKNRASKLQEADVAAIRARYTPRSKAHGLGPIGEKYGVSPGCIRDIIIRKTWRHV